jgi:hypothetical protein
LGNGFDGVQGLDLLGREGGQVLGPGMSFVAQESGATKVHDELGVLIEDDWAALESRPG